MARNRRRSATAVPLSLLVPLAAAALLVAYSPSAHSRLLLTGTEPDRLPLSDGIDATGSRFLAPYLQLRSLSAEQCEQTYGFMPCTTTAVGNLFLLLVYGFLMFQAAKYLSNGSEMLLQILGPGIVGGLFLPILGALPDAILIFVSGISGTKEEAQSQVLIGMGLLAGSTVMLLTLLWGSCVVVGSTDIVDGLASDDSQEGGRKLSLFGSGISTDIQTSHAAKIMIISIIPFVIMQLPKIFKSPSWTKITVPVALILAVVFLLSYCVYQIYQPWIQKRRLAYAKLKHVISGILKHAHSLGRLLHEDGTLNTEVIEKLFKKIDRDDSGTVTRDELYALIVGIQLDLMDFNSDDAVDHVMNDFDTDHNRSIDIKEFIDGFKRWIAAAKSAFPGTHPSKDIIHDFHDRTRQEHGMLAEEEEEEVEHIENPTWISLTAVLYLLLGTVIAVLFADPLVDAVDNFSDATHIPSFFISFIAMPLATNSSEAVSALIFASRKKLRTSSLTFSEIYGAVTMNNTLCLAVFLALVYVRGLTWDFSAEVLIILIVCVVMGLFSSFRTTFPLWTSSVAYLLYPFSLALVYLLDYKFGWS